MLNVPHFGISSSNTMCVRQLLVFIHDGHLWMGNKIPIDQMFIWRIIILPYQGQNPTKEFVGKDQDRVVAENMKKKYGLVKGNKGYDINSINDQTVFYVAHILARNIMRKSRANEFPTLVVSLATQCTYGV